MLLGCVLAFIVYRRVRGTQLRLEASRGQLQAQSERDPMTNLANRRHFHAVMTTLCGQSGFEGGLLLVDLDHSKHINDAQGHAAGDQVLIEVAKRLNEAVRSDNGMVGWGGEEFLILRAAGRQRAGRADGGAHARADADRHRQRRRGAHAACHRLDRVRAPSAAGARRQTPGPEAEEKVLAA